VTGSGDVGDGGLHGVDLGVERQARLGLAPAPLSETRIRETPPVQGEDPLGKPRRVVGLHEVPRQPSGQDLGIATDARGHDRDAARQRLHHRP